MFKILLLSVFGFLFSYESFDYNFLKPKPNKSKATQTEKNPYDKIIDGYEKIEGLFDFYWNEDKNKCYLQIHKAQFYQIVLDLTL